MRHDPAENRPERLGPPMTRVNRALRAWGPETTLALTIHQASYQTVSLANIRIIYFVFLICVLVTLFAYHRDVLLPRLRGPSRDVYIALLPMGLFTGMYLVSSFWSPLPFFGAQRGIKAAVVGSLGVLAGALVAAQPHRLRRLVWAILAVGLLVLCTGLVSCILQGWGSSLPSVFGVKYGVQANSVGMAWMCALGLLFAVGGTDARSLRGALVLSLALALATFAALQSGSRGLALSLGSVGGCCCAYGLSRRELRSHAAVGIAGVLLGAVLFAGLCSPDSKAMKQYRNLYAALSQGSMEQASVVARARSPIAVASAPPAQGQEESTDEISPQERTQRLTPAEMLGRPRETTTQTYGPAGKGLEADLSLRSRLGLFHAAVALFRKHWAWGTGAGGYFAHTGCLIAHNAIADVMAETGVIGLALLAVWLLQVLLLPRQVQQGDCRHKIWKPWHALWMVLAYSLVRAQFGTFFDENRLLFLLWPLLLLARPTRSSGAPS